MDPRKIQAIVDWKAPTNVWELRNFHGLTKFYGKFIKGSSEIATPLTK